MTLPGQHDAAARLQGTVLLVGPGWLGKVAAAQGLFGGAQDEATTAAAKNV